VTERGVVVPALLRQVAVHLGAEGTRWLAELLARLSDLERRWGLTLGQSLPGGSRSYVVRARTGDGLDAVLKLAVPDPALSEQVRMLRRARGCGYVRVLAADFERHAVLLEALGPALDRLPLSPEAQIVALWRTLRAAWRLERPPDVALAEAHRKPHGLAELVSNLWGDLGRPCSEAVVERALVFAERRAAATCLDRVVIVHGDPHPGNALRILAPRAGAKSGFVFVDPEGFVADPAYDLGVVLRDWCPQLLAGDAPALAAAYCRQLAALSGLDEAAIWEWGFLERVSTGLYVLQYGAEEMARPFLATAELLARTHPGDDPLG
jgi:streptomycin 6-kinase